MFIYVPKFVVCMCISHASCVQVHELPGPLADW